MSATEAQTHREWVLAALDEFEGRLTRYAARLLGNEDQARDAVQHTYLKLCDQQQDKLGKGLAAWLFTVCRNMVLDIVRKEKKRECWDDTAMEKGDGSADPAHQAEQADLHASLLRLVDRLPETQREAVDLWTQGFNYREIATITHRSEGSVRVLVHRALTHLREHPFVQSWLRDDPPQNGKPTKPTTNRENDHEYKRAFTQ